MEPTHKNCSVCEQKLPLEDFRRETKGKYGRRSFCKLCENIKKHRYYVDNKDKMKAKVKSVRIIQQEFKRLCKIRI